MPFRIPTIIAVLLLSTVRVAGAQCAFQHPASAKILQGSLVQAFTACTTNSPSFGVDPNTTTESGDPSCYPAQTWNEHAGSPGTGWIWGPRGTGKVTFKVGAGDVAVDDLVRAFATRLEAWVLAQPHMWSGWYQMPTDVVAEESRLAG